MKLPFALCYSLGALVAMVRAEPPSPAEEVSSDPAVLQIEMYPPRGDAAEMGPNLMMGMIEGKLALVVQLKPSATSKTDFAFERESIQTRITVAVQGDAPPYTVVFKQSISPVQPPKIAERRQDVVFPVGKVTRARLFDLVEIRGFYGNPEKKRP